MSLNDLAYRVLMALSHSRKLKTNSHTTEDHSPFDSYSVHDRDKKFLEFMSKYQIDYTGKSVIDIGCGGGDLGITLAKTGARKVVGVDIDNDRIIAARRKAEEERVGERVAFECYDFVSYVSEKEFDIAFTKAAFEHILSPLDVLINIHRCLADEGVLATLFGPLWLSPYGSHMREFTPVPWVHLLFPEKVILRVRAERYRPDEKVERYEDIRGHLNRITVKEFRKYVAKAGFRVLRFRLNPGLDHWDRGAFRAMNMMINANPVLQEIFSFQLLAILQKDSSPSPQGDA